MIGLVQLIVWQPELAKVQKDSQTSLKVQIFCY